MCIDFKENIWVASTVISLVNVAVKFCKYILFIKHKFVVMISELAEMQS